MSTATHIRPAIGTMFMLPGEFHAHSLGKALRAGQLFSLPVNP